MRVFNNTIYNCTSNGLFIKAGGTDATRNNISYSNSNSFAGTTSTNNTLDPIDPGFVSVIDTDDTFLKIDTDSVSYNVGFDTSSIVTIDYFGTTRPQGSTIDIGAHESNTMEIYYISTTGNNGNDGSIGSPWATFSYALGQMNGGDTLNVRAGTYSQTITNPPNGTSWTNATTVQAYNGEVVTLNSSATKTLDFTGNYEYIIVDGLTFDGAGGGNWGIHIKGISTSSITHHIRIKDCVVKNYSGNGILGSYYTNNLEFIDTTAHDNGTDNRLDHGFYLASDDTLLDGCIAYNNASIGIHTYSNIGVQNCVVKNCITYDNGGVSTVAPGIGIYTGSGHQIYNCVTYGNPYGIRLRHGANNAQVYNNTVYNNTVGGILTDDDNGIIRNNILYSNAGNEITDNGLNNTWDHNLEVDPTFVDAADPDGADNIFRTSDDGLALQSSSGATNSGTANIGGLFTDDIIGTSRPQGLGWGIGAYEFISSGSSDTESPTAPTNLIGTSTSHSQVGLTWTAATDNDSVSNYRIYRDDFTVGNHIAEVGITTTYTSTGLSEETSYEHKVSAVDPSNNEGPQSISDITTTISDIIKPTITSVTAISGVIVDVLFSEDVDTVTSNTSSNYTINNGISVSSAQQISSDNVRLSVSTLSSAGITYTITINNVKDTANTQNEILADSTYDFVWASDLGLVSWFRFNEGSGQTLADSVGSSTAILGSSAGISTNDPTWVIGINGISDGWALQFDGIDDLVSVTNDSNLDNMTEFTYTAWINTFNWGGSSFGRIISRETSIQNDIYFHVQEGHNGGFGSEVFNNVPNGFVTDSGSDIGEITLNLWLNVSLTYSHSGDKTPSLYLNGIELAFYDNEETVAGTLLGTTNDFIIGNMLTGIRAFDGKITNVKIFNKALSSAQILAEYNSDISDINSAKKITDLGSLSLLGVG